MARIQTLDGYIAERVSKLKSFGDIDLPDPKVGGILLSHNINANDAFSHFSQSTGSKVVRMASMSSGINRLISTGGMVKV